MSNITLNTLVYTGDGLQPNGVSRWTNRALGIVAAFKALTTMVKTSTKSRSVTSWKLVYPFPETPSTECPCDGALPYQDTIVNVEFRFDPRADTAYRAAVRLSTKDLLLSSQLIDSVDNLNQPT